jgi:hypothetical protein
MQIIILTQDKLRDIYLRNAQARLENLASSVKNLQDFDELKLFVEDMQYHLDEDIQELFNYIVENELHIAAVGSEMPAMILAETESVDGRHTCFAKVFDANHSEDVKRFKHWHGATATVSAPVTAA